MISSCRDVEGRRIRSEKIFLLLVFLGFFVAVPAAAQSPTMPFSFPDNGGLSLTTTATSALSVGYAQITQTGADAAGYATFDLSQNGVLVSEATVPAAVLVNQGRVYAEIGGGVDTGIAIANTNDSPVNIGFYFTDASGGDFGQNVLTLDPGGQISQFLSQPPFNGPTGLAGTFTFFVLSPDPTLRVGAIALRGLVNERGDFLMTTLPVAPVGQRGLFSGNVLPQFAAGAGWTTQVILVNPTDDELAGTVSFSSQAGAAAIVAVGTSTASTYAYRIPPKSASSLQTSNSGPLQVGSVLISSSIPTMDIPIGFLIFSLQSGGITISTAGVPPPRPATLTRLFVEASGAAGTAAPDASVTGFAVSNAGSTIPVPVSFDLTNLDGTSTGLHGEIDIPAGGQIARFVTQIPGFEELAVPFQGVLHLSAPTDVSVIGLRGRYNVRSDFLMTTVPAVNQNDDYFNLSLRYSEFIFPHFVDGGGFTTQFVLFSGWTSGAVNGTLDFFTQDGKPFPLELEAH